MKITVCIGSSCHLKGSKQIVEQLRHFIEENGLNNMVELGATFCMGRCQKGVSISIGEKFYSLTPENVNEFFNKHVLGEI